MDPNRAVVMMLQLRAEKLFSSDYMARQLPFDYDVGEEFTKISVEDAREAMLQSVYGYAQSIPAMAQMGMDPGEAVARMAAIVKGLQKGCSVEEVVAEAFAPAPQPSPAEATPDAGLGGEPAGVGGGLTEAGLMRGVSPGQAGMAPVGARTCR